MDIPTFKLVVIGDGGVGKTTFIRRHLTGEFEKKYLPTLGVKVNSLVFWTNYGSVRFHIWDCNYVSQELLEADCAILMSDLQQSSVENLNHWLESLEKLSPLIPKVVCYNKMDDKDQCKNQKKAWFQRVTGKFREMKIQQELISAKSNYNFEKPFLYLGRILMDKPDLAFVPAPALPPPEVIMPSVEAQVGVMSTA